MGWDGNGFVAPTFRDILLSDPTVFWDGLSLALWGDTVTPDFSSDDLYGEGQWSSGEVVGSGWPAGGQPLSNVSVVSFSGNTVLGDVTGVRIDADDVIVSNTTLNDMRGFIVYCSDDSDPFWEGKVLLGYDFGDSYSTLNGTLTLAFHADGLGLFSLVGVE